MKIYFLNLESKPILNGIGRFVAASKATSDVKQLMLSMPDVIYKSVVRHTDHKIWGAFEIVIGLLWQFLRIPKGEVLFVQYPIVNINAYYPFRKCLRKRKVIGIIHDLQSYRYPQFYHLRDKELSILNCMSCLIVHSENMKKLLEDDGVSTPMTVLGIFDYLLRENQSCKHTANTIVFAGALEKSLFLKDIFKIDLGKNKLFTYGGIKPDLPFNDVIQYKGRFMPDDIRCVEGEWGLMWDGNSIESCEGNFGEYLTIIAPHKLSLYIACGLKVIVWEKSAMAQLVKEKCLGFSIKTISEIPDIIASLSSDESKRMYNNVVAFSEQIRRGDMFINAFNCSLSKILKQ